METIIVLIGLALLVLPIVAVVVSMAMAGRVNRLVNTVSRLETRVWEVERRVSSVAAEMTKQPEVRPRDSADAAELTSFEQPSIEPTPTAEQARNAEAPTAGVPEKTPARPPEIVPLEERLGARLPIWIGSVALALAGGYLVKFTHERGLLGPGMRVILAMALGIVLVLAGNWMHRRVNRLAQGLSAAGVATLFAAFWAATNLYGLIPPVVGFLGMAVVVAVAVALSVRQGPLIALLGLIEGFLAPLLVGVEENHPATLFGYLFLLQLGLLSITTRRSWWHISTATLVASLAWCAGWLVFAFEVEHSVWVSAFLVGSVATFSMAAWHGKPVGATVGWSFPIVLSWACMIGCLSIEAMVLHVAGFAAQEWVFLWILSAGCLVLGRIDGRYHGLAWLATFCGLALLVLWSTTSQPADLTLYAVCLASMGGLMAIGSYVCSWKSKQQHWWITLCTTAVVGYLLTAYVCIGTFFWDSLEWSLVFGAAAALLVWAALRNNKRRDRVKHSDISATVLLTGALVLLSAALAIALDSQWVALAWSAQLPVAAWLLVRLELKHLRPVVGTMAGLVLVFLFLNPYNFEVAIGQNPILNWIVATYGGALLAFSVTGFLLRKAGNDQWTAMFSWSSIVLVLALATLEVRQIFHPGQIWVGVMSPDEQAMIVMVWLCTAFVLLFMGKDGRSDLLGKAAKTIAMVAIAVLLVGLGLLSNPLWHPHPVGEAIFFNRLLLWYGLPAAVTGAIAVFSGRQNDTALARLMGLVTVILVVVLVSLNVRQGYHGTWLSQGDVTNAEMYAYSASWMALGTVFLILGIKTKGKMLRYAALSVMLLSVGKVFLFDTAQLRGLLRVLSLLGLGGSLMLLAYLYQRFVFSERKQKQVTEGCGPDTEHLHT